MLTFFWSLPYELKTLQYIMKQFVLTFLWNIKKANCWQTMVQILFHYMVIIFNIMQVLIISIL